MSYILLSKQNINNNVHNNNNGKIYRLLSKQFLETILNKFDNFLKSFLVFKNETLKKNHKFSKFFVLRSGVILKFNLTNYLIPIYLIEMGFDHLLLRYGFDRLLSLLNTIIYQAHDDCYYYYFFF